MLTGHQTRGMLFAGLESFEKTDSIMSLQMSADLICRISLAVFFQWIPEVLFHHNGEKSVISREQA